MASTWGLSWGTSWASSWGGDEVVASTARRSVWIDELRDRRRRVRGLERAYKAVDDAVAQARREQDEARKAAMLAAAEAARLAAERAEAEPFPDPAPLLASLRAMVDLGARSKAIQDEIRRQEMLAAEIDDDDAVILLLLN